MKTATMREIVVKPEIRVQFRRSGRQCWCVAHVITVAGPLTFCARIDLDKARAAVKKRMAERGGGKTETGAFFDSVGKLAAQVAKAKALDTVMKQVAEIQKDPEVAKAVGLATVVVPGSGAAHQAIVAASATLRAAKDGDEATIAKVRQIATLAEAGHPKAIKALRVMQLVRQHEVSAEAQLDPKKRLALAVAYSRELGRTLPPALLAAVRPALDKAIAKGGGDSTAGVAVGWG